MKRSKAQISIFIIIAVIILLLMVFLIFFSFNDSRSELDLLRNSQEELLPLKENLDTCLETQLKRAVIISGIKGGFIYDHDLYYTLTSVPSNAYNELVGPLDLNWNYLLWNTLVHHQTSVFVPELDKPLILNAGPNTIEIYDQSLKDDFELFILEEFIECIDLERYVEAGLDVDYERYGGQIKRFTSPRDLELTDIDAEVGDRIQFSIEGEIYFGEVISTGLISNDIHVRMDTDELSTRNTDAELSSINALNLNGNIDIDVVFEDEKIGVSLSYPVTLTSGDKVTSYKQAFVEIDVRQRKLLDIGEQILRDKNEDREIDLYDSFELQNILNDIPYLQNTDLQDFSFSIVTNNNSDEYKNYVISIIDENSRILGSPFVMNFGYENHAPNIDISKMPDLDPELAENGIIAVLSEDEEIVIDLKPLTSDPQILDNENSYYIPDEYAGIDAYYRLDSDGTLTFRGFQEKLYTFEVKVTDKEAIRTVPIRFLVGFPDNTDNQAADQCFEFRNFEIGGSFPINSDYKNEIFSFTNGLGVKELYAYSLYLPNTNPVRPSLRNSELTFLPSCLVTDALFGGFYVMTSPSGGVIESGRLPDDGKMTIPISNQIITVTVNVLSASNLFGGFGLIDLGFTPVATQPYQIKIYPANCLGPKDGDSSTGTCCNTAALDNSVSTNNPSNFATGSNLWQDGRTVAQEDFYFCNDVHAKHLSGNFVNIFEVLNIWELDPKASDLFEANVRMTCQGGSAYGDFSTISASGADYFRPITGYGSSQSIIPTSISGSFRTLQEGTTCDFCYISNPENFVVQLNNGITLVAGLKSENTPSQVGVSPIFNDGRFNSLGVICEDENGLEGLCRQGQVFCDAGPGFPDGPPPLPGTFPDEPEDPIGDPTNPSVPSGTIGEITQPFEIWGVGGGGAMAGYSINPFNDQIRFVGTDMGTLFRTVDGGDSWVPVSHFQTTYHQTLADALGVGFSADGVTVFHAPQGLNPVRSLNGGATFSTTPMGLASGEKITEWYGDTQNENLIFAMTNQGLWRTTNKGDSWDKIFNSGAVVGMFINHNAVSKEVYFATSSTIYRSITDGTNPVVHFTPSGHQIRKFTGGSSSSKTTLAYASNEGSRAVSVSGVNGVTASDSGMVYVNVNNGGYTQTSQFVGTHLRMAENDPDTIYATGSRDWQRGKGTSVYVSTNAGNSWNLRLLQYNWDVNPFQPASNSDYAPAGLEIGWFDAGYYTFDINKLNSNQAGGSGNFFLHTTENKGSNWNAPTSEFKDTGARTQGKKWQTRGIEVVSIYDIKFHPANDNDIYAAVADITGLRSTDHGSSWEVVDIGHNSIYDYAFHLTNQNIVYAAAGDEHDWPFKGISQQNPAVGGGVYRSVNKGDSWTRLTPTSSQFNRQFLSVGYDTNRNIVYGGSQGDGIARSLNGGNTWSYFNNGLPTSWDLVIPQIEVMPNGNVYALVSGNGLGFENRDETGIYFLDVVNGAPSWQHLRGTVNRPSGLESQYDVWFRPLSFAVDPSNEGTLWMTDTELSTNQWQASGIWKSTDRGNTWNRVQQHTFPINIKIDPTNNENVIVAGIYTLDGTWGEGGILVTGDGGSSWTKDTRTLLQANSYSVAYDPKDSSKVVYGFFGGGMVYGDNYFDSNGFPTIPGVPTGDPTNNGNDDSSEGGELVVPDP